MIFYNSFTIARRDLRSNIYYIYNYINLEAEIDIHNSNIKRNHIFNIINLTYFAVIIFKIIDI